MYSTIINNVTAKTLSFLTNNGTINTISIIVFIIESLEKYDIPGNQKLQLLVDTIHILKDSSKIPTYIKNEIQNIIDLDMLYFIVKSIVEASKNLWNINIKKKYSNFCFV